MEDPMKKASAFIASIAFAATMSVTVSASSVTAQFDKEADNGKAELNEEVTPAQTGQPAIVPNLFDESLANIKDAYIINLHWNDLSIVNGSTPEPTETPAPDVKCKFILDEETAEINAFINNTYEEDKDVVVVIAQYNDKGKVVNTTFKKITVPGQTITPKQYTVKADCIPESKSSIMGFVWEDFESMKPIARLIE